MTKMAVIPIYGKKKKINKNKSLCPVTILVDSQMSDRCPWATCLNFSESAKYSKHLINRVLHGAPIIEVIFLREEKPVLALLMLSAKQGSHWYHF